jgi:hypothetical protein
MRDVYPGSKVGVQDPFQNPTLKVLKIRHRRKKTTGEISIKNNNYVFGMIIYALKAKNQFFSPAICS